MAAPGMLPEQEVGFGMVPQGLWGERTHTHRSG